MEQSQEKRRTATEHKIAISVCDPFNQPDDEEVLAGVGGQGLCTGMCAVTCVVGCIGMCEMEPSGSVFGSALVRAEAYDGAYWGELGC